jgi:type 1 glutamine amidotransferase
MDMRKIFLPIILALLCLTGTRIEGGDNDDHRGIIKVLIVDGFSNHDWEATTKAISSILHRDEEIEIHISTVPNENTDSWKEWKPPFNNYAVVIQNTNDISKEGSWPEPAKRSLESYIANGGGMLVFHSANNAFPDWVEYNRMIGLGWRNKEFGPAIVVKDDKPVTIPAGEGDHTGHGERVDAVITRMGEHPVHRGLPKEWMAADIEVYRYARGPAENISILSYAKDAETGLNFPTEWVVEYDKGRIYNSTFGHYWHNLPEDPPGIRCIGFRTLLHRATRWLAGAEITEDAPDNFPSKDQISLADPN